MQNVDPSIYYPYHTQYPSGQTYYSNSGNTTRNRVGATMLGCLVGMTAYFLPVNKDVFVERAFEERKNEISKLNRAEQEPLRNSITQPAEVRRIKAEFANNFNNVKKDAHLRNNAESAALKAIKWNHFAWGVGICGAIGLAFSLLTSRD